MKLNLRAHIRLALFYFFLVAVLGATLRLFVIADIPATYRHLVHTHSHVALLGWVYVALTTLLCKLYLQKEDVAKPYRRLFWFTQLTIAGMLLSFPFQGYAFFSILFSTLFLFATYFFTRLFLKKAGAETKKRFSFKLVKASLFFLVFSSIGPWALGAIMTTLGSTSIWYKLSIYFYLHFQYNGWFILALLGILFYFLEEYGLFTETKKDKLWIHGLNLSVVLSFFLSALWIKPPVIIYILAALGAVLQAVVLIMLFFRLLPLWNAFAQKLVPGVSGLLLLSGLVLALKADMQLLSVIPNFAMLAYHVQDFVIGYIHLVFLGVVTIALFAFLKQAGLLKLPKAIFHLYLLAFLTMEFLLFYKGTAIWLRLPVTGFYYELLFAASLLFPVAVGGLFVFNLKGDIGKKIK